MTAPGSPPYPPLLLPPGVVPGPPPGPGVQPPFVAPPTDGTRRRRGQAIALIITAVFLCCVGSIAGLGGLVVLGERAFSDEAKTAVTRYVSAIQTNDYARAYTLLCTPLRQQLSETEFARSFDDQPTFLSFTVGEPAVSTNQGYYAVPVVLHTAAGSDQSRHYLVAQDRTTAQFKVCGVED